jgi:hypothetical protein
MTIRAFFRPHRDLVTILVNEPYTNQLQLWPATGRHILAQFDERMIIVYADIMGSP